MRILLLNPNTSQSFTELIGEIAEAYKSENTEIVAQSPLAGPRSIESIYDELLSAEGSLRIFLEAKDEFDGFILACFSDHPVIYALRELTHKPVIGIAEASMYMACMLGHKFSIVTTNDEWKPLLWDAVNHYGLEKRCTSVRTTGMPVLALEEKGDASFELIKKAAELAITKDGAEVICLGCAGMAGLDKKLENDLQVPVIDGVVAALKLMEALVSYGVKTSKRLAFSYPQRKDLDALDEIFYSGYIS